MSEEILVNVTPQETRVAVVENGALQEVLIERTAKRGLLGNIYRGVVSRVLPGMQAAFIDIGEARTAFLHVSDMGVSQHSGNDNGATCAPPIEGLLRDGQEIMVQVTKDPIGSKGARLTTQIAIPSRYMVFMPDGDSIGISQRIEQDDERERLRDIVAEHHASLAETPPCDDDTASEQDEKIQGGYIIRTAAEGLSQEELCRDMQFLRRLWASTQSQIENASAPACIYSDLPLALRTMRDLVSASVEKIRIDSRETYQKALAFARQFVPEVVERMEHYPGERPILDLYSIEDELQRALQRRVDLKSGGHIVFDQTEAMTTIDINTGGFVGHRNLEETIYKTNLEAAQAIARQLRLRNLGGIIIIDFIDMTDAEHQRQVLRALEKNLERDHARTSISEITSLGLVQLTRKRTRESLEHILCEPCPTCCGRGSIKTAETVCYEILREILREVRQFEAKNLLVVASQEVVDKMLDDESTSVAELESFIGKSVRFQVETRYSPEQYDVVLL